MKTKQMSNPEIFRIGEGYLRQKLYSDALECFLKVKRRKFISSNLSSNFEKCGHGLLNEYQIDNAAKAFKASSAGIPKTAFKLVGNKLSMKGNFEGAITAYNFAGAKSKITALCIRLINSGAGRDLILKAFKIKGAPVLKKKFLARCEKELCKAYDFKNEMRFYKAINETPSKEVLLSFGERNLLNENLENAVLAYKMAKISPPKDGLIACGNSALQRGVIHTAIESYSLAGVDALIILGEKLFSSHKFRDAATVFIRANHKAGIEKCAGRLIEQGSVKDAVQIYKNGRVTLPENTLIKKGFERLKYGGDPREGALECFLPIKHKEGIIACADLLLKKGFGGPSIGGGYWNAPKDMVQAEANKIYKMAEAL